MDISLEFDIDYSDLHQQPSFVDNSSEVIKDYLRGKIDDLKQLSEISKKNLRGGQDHQNQCLKYLKESEYSRDGSLHVRNIWQRVNNGKWIVGVQVRNTAERVAENVEIVFRCIPKQNVEYSMQLYAMHSENIPEEIENIEKNKTAKVKEIFNTIKASLQNSPTWTLSQKIEKEATIVLLITLPQFVDFREIKLEGIISYEMSNKNYQNKLTNISLKVDDVLTDELTIKLNSIINGDEEAFLSILSTSVVTSAKIIIPEGIYRTLEGILQLDCYFTKANIPGEEMILVYDGNSPSLSSAMIKFTPGNNDIEIITKNDEQLYFFYHHLYKNIPDVIILNENCEQIHNQAFLTRPTQIFLEPVEQDQTFLKDFADAFDDQLIFLENKINKTTDVDSLVLGETNDEYKLFRNNLSALEMKSDELFLKAFDKKM